MTSQLTLAKQFLANHPDKEYTPDEVKEALGLSMTGATLGRKFRAAAAMGELRRGSRAKVTGSGAYSVYSHNPEFRSVGPVAYGTLFGGME